jgi:CPA2 family monovalent cation:H+ antiporter-2
MEGFLLQASVYLLTMVIAVPIALRLGLGSVLGYLLAGIVIGPVLGFAGTQVTELQHFAEFGVVMMLFLIGLDVEPMALWHMRHRLLGLGGLQIVVTSLLIMLSLLLMDQDWHAALAIGVILSLSSTAIVLQTLSEKSLMQTAGGRNVFSVLLMQDIAVIPILAFLPFLALPAARALARSETGGEGVALSLIDQLPPWGVTLVTVGAVVGVITAGRYLVRPLYRYVSSARLREMQTALALLIVAGIASLMLMVGLSPALGTFLAGMVLANSEFRHELESDIAPFKSLLLGLFFVTVGAGIDFKLLLAEPVRILLLTLLLMLTKGLVLHGLAWIFRLRERNRWLFTLSLAQGGEFGFVLISFALTQRILTSTMAQTMMLVIAMSMLLSPLFFILYDQIVIRLKDDAERLGEDTIDEQQPVIIAGVGRFGQVVNRIVTMSGFKTTILDADPRTIEVLRNFGFKGYVGDPTRPDLLTAAGINTARILVVCLDDHDATTKLVRYARRIRPDLHIIARARDREHVYELFQAGADDIVREMFDSALRAGRYVLETSGLTEYEAAELQKTFYQMDRAAVRDLAEVWQPGVPAAQNPAYMKRTRELNKGLEAALTAQFSNSRSLPPEIPEPGAAKPATEPKTSGLTQRPT